MTTRRRKRHNPEQIVRKLRDADAMLHAGQDLAAAQLAGVRCPCRVHGSLHCFRSGVAFGYASANSSAPAVQRSYPTQTFIRGGTGI